MSVKLKRKTRCARCGFESPIEEQFMYHELEDGYIIVCNTCYDKIMKSKRKVS